MASTLDYIDDVTGEQVRVNVVNPDGTYGVVLMNENAEGLTFQIEAGDHFFSITLPGKSITTCVIPK